MALRQPDPGTVGRLVLVGGLGMAFAALAVLARGDVGLPIDELARVAPPGFPIELFRHLHDIALVQLGLALPLVVSGWGLHRRHGWAVVLARCAVTAVALAIVVFVAIWGSTVGLRLPGVSLEVQAFHLFFFGMLTLSALTLVAVCGAVLWALRSASLTLVR